ncbi:MAG: DUF4838 domain-containing protein [Kiritimatiellae bacterium]|nr:DUF4838 domain-containing protein [Kiritimatiellia bacterium]
MKINAGLIILAGLAILTMAIFLMAPAYMTLAEGKTSAYVIVVGNNASLPEKFAAEELQGYLKKICGANIPIKKAGDGRFKRMILVGTPASNPLVGERRKDSCFVAGKRGGAMAFSSREEELDAFQVETRNGHLLLAGSNPRASLYAVYDFLEQNLGVFWPSVFPEEEIVPRREKIILKKIKYRECAGFKYRGYALADLHIIDWMAKHKMNRAGLSFKTCDNTNYYRNTLLPEIQKRGIMLSAATHGFHYFIAPEKYFGEHPEYYCLPSGSGKRVPGQFCTYNKEALKIYTDNFLAFMARHPEIDFFHPSQEDGYGWCECPLCGNEKWEVIRSQAMASDKLLNAVNSVADEAGTRFPGKPIVFQGYVATGPVPKQAKPRANVIAMLAFFEKTAGDIAATNIVSYHSCPDIFAYYRRIIREWTEIVPEVFIYEYYCGRSAWNGRPMVLSRNIRNSLKYFVDHGVKGLVSQGGYKWWRAYLLNHYLLAELLWNVNADVDVLTRNFCALRYGKAAGAMERYFNNFEAAAFDECALDLKNAERLAENAAIADLIRYQQILYGWNRLYGKMHKCYIEIPKLIGAKDKDHAKAMYAELLLLEQETQRYLDETKLQQTMNSPNSFYQLSKILREKHKWLVMATEATPKGLPADSGRKRPFEQADENE